MQGSLYITQFKVAILYIQNYNFARVVFCKSCKAETWSSETWNVQAWVNH